MSQRQFRFLHAANLRLDQPPYGMVEVPDYLVDTLIDCPLQAATRLFDSAIDLRVSFVLLSGNTLNAARAAPREINFLVEQFNRLAAQNIAVFWSADDFAPSVLWPAYVSWPANVKVFPSNGISRLDHVVGGRSICEVVCFSGKPAVLSPLVELHGDDANVFRIGIGPREWTEVPTQMPGFQYWAFGNSHERQSHQNAHFQVHLPGTHQGRSPVEDGPHGATLVSVDEEQQIKLRPLDFDGVRFIMPSINVSLKGTPTDLEELLLDRAKGLRDENSDRTLLVQWKISCEPKERAALRQGTLASDLASKLNIAFGQAAPYVWTCGVEAAMPAEPPVEWNNEQTLRGDFLRAISQVSFNVDPLARPSSALFELPNIVRERLPNGGGTVEQQQVLHDAAWLGGRLVESDGGQAMKVSDIHIDGYGVWRGLTLQNLSPECTVFYGRNEAGKSTLLEFLRGMLFGFAAETKSSFMLPANGGTAGGHLMFLSGDSQVGRLYRHARSEGVTDSLSLTVQDEPLAETALPTLLCDVDQKTFNNVFAVGLRELQELGTLEDLHASRWLYSLTAGLDRVSLSDVTRELEYSRSRIVSGDATSQVAQLLNERSRLQRELDDLAELPRHLEQLLSHRDSIDREIESTHIASTTIASDVPALEISIAIYDLWHRGRALTSQIDSLQSGNTWPANALEKMDQLRKQYTMIRRESRNFKAERKKLATELTSLKFDERLWRQSAPIAALAEHEAWILSAEQEFQDAETNAKRLDEQYSSRKSQLSNSPASSAVSAAIDSSAWAILRNPASKISQARRRLKKVRAACDQHRSAALGQKQEIDKALSGRGHRDLATAVENCGARVQQLRRRIQLQKQLEENLETQAELETRVADLLEQQVLPPTTTVNIGAFFVVGLVLILSGLLLPASFTGSWAWPMVILGVFGTGFAVAAKYGMEHAVVADLESAKKQLSMAETQSEQMQAELKQLDEVLPKGGGPLNLRLQNAEQELAKLEQLLPLESQRQSADRQAQEQEEKLAAAERIYKKCRRRWKAALASVGLPGDTSPLQAQEIAMAGGRLSAANARLGDANSDVERRRRELNALSARIQQVFLAAGLQPESSKTSAQLRQLTNELAKHEKIQQERRSLVLQRRRLRRKQLAVADRIEQLRRRRGFLLKKCEVIDVADFNRRAADSSKIKALTAERDSANREIELTIGNRIAREAVEHHVNGKTRQQLDDLLVDMRKQIAVLHDKRNALDRQRSELATQIEGVSADRRSAIKRFQLGLVEERLAAALRRWQTLTVTHEVLSQVKADYEKNRQPEALRDASKYLAQFTCGRYVRVWTTFGEDTLLVQDAQGHSLQVEQLSRGTREQLFLSLRMAIVGMFARRGAHLPMILDDVLVNFDNERAGAGIEVLLEFARRGHQLIVFTCHEHIARMFKLRGADVRRLPESGRPGQDHPFELEEPAEKESELEEPVMLPAVSVTTTQSEIVAGPSTIEITAQVVNTPAQVDVHFVEPPAAPVVPTRRARLRVDTPQRKRNSVATIRRRWSAEEFSGELDDRINPQWLLNELSPEAKSAVESVSESNRLTESLTHYQRVAGRRLLKLFEAEQVPVIVEGHESGGDADF